jgi:hypothetical protein
LRDVLPQSEPASRIKPDAPGQRLSFAWSGAEFVAGTNLEVFELKNQKLFATGHSTLISVALMSRARSRKICSECLGSLDQIESMLKNDSEREDGMKLLLIVKTTLTRLGGLSARPPGPKQA